MRVLLATAAGIDRDDPPIVSIARLQRPPARHAGHGRAGCRGARHDPRHARRTAHGRRRTWTRSGWPSSPPGRSSSGCDRLAADAPVVVAVDDVADADPSSLEILAPLAADPPAAAADRRSPRTRSPRCPVRSSGTGPRSSSWRRTVRVGLRRPDRRGHCGRAARAARDASRSAGRARASRCTWRSWPGRRRRWTGRALPITLAGRLQARLASPGVDREVVGALAVAGHDVEEDVLAAVLGVDGRRSCGTGSTGLIARDLVVDIGGDRLALPVPPRPDRRGGLRPAAQRRPDAAARPPGRRHGRRHRLGHRLDWNVVGAPPRLAGRPLDAFEASSPGAEEAERAGSRPTRRCRATGTPSTSLAKISDVGVRDVLEIRCRLQRGAHRRLGPGLGRRRGGRGLRALRRALPPAGPAAGAPVRDDRRVLVLPAPRRARRGPRGSPRTCGPGSTPRHDDYRAGQRARVSASCASTRATTPAALEHLRRAAELFDRAAAGRAARAGAGCCRSTRLAITLSHLGDRAVDHRLARRGQRGGATGRWPGRPRLPFPEGPFSMAYAKSFLAWTYDLGGHHRTAARFASGGARRSGSGTASRSGRATGEIHLAIAEHRRRPAAGRRRHASRCRRRSGSSSARGSSSRTSLTAAAQLRAEMGQLADAAAGFEAAGAARRGDRGDASTKPSACACSPGSRLLVPRGIAGRLRPGVGARAASRARWCSSCAPPSTARSWTRPTGAIEAPRATWRAVPARGGVSRAQRGAGAAGARPCRPHDAPAPGS